MIVIVIVFIAWKELFSGTSVDRDGKAHNDLERHSEKGSKECGIAMDLVRPRIGEKEEE